ncbi:MAG: DUF6428 family protein [Flavobacterium sp.]
MKLSEFKTVLQGVDTIQIQLPDGSFVPSHFHITEMGLLIKNFIDCGNTIREERLITFQLWFAGDLEHRLTFEKVFKIISASQNLIGDQDLELEVEYQMESTIGKFGLDFFGGNFVLTSKQTTCLADDHCGIPVEKMKVSLKDLQPKINSCTTNSGCC